MTVKKGGVFFGGGERPRLDDEGGRPVQKRPAQQGWGEAQLLALAGNVELRRRSRTLFSRKLVWMETATT